MLEGQTAALRHILKLSWKSNTESVMLGKMAKLIHRAIYRVVWSPRRENELLPMVMEGLSGGGEVFLLEQGLLPHLSLQRPLPKSVFLLSDPKAIMAKH